MVTVFAELEGHSFDIDALARHFPSGEPRIVVIDEGTFLAAELDDLFNDAGRLVEAATEHLDRLNGYAVLMDAGYRRVRLRNKFFRESNPAHVHVVVHDEARARESVTVVMLGTAEERATAFGVTAIVGGVPVQPPPPEGPSHLARAASDKDVADLLALVGKAERLSWSELYKVFEIIRDSIGRGRDGLVATGWTTKDELSAFTGSADHHLVSGIHDGRHARSSGGPPKRTMTLDEAQRYIRDLARRWLDSRR